MVFRHYMEVKTPYQLGLRFCSIPLDLLDSVVTILEFSNSKWSSWIAYLDKNMHSFPLFILQEIKNSYRTFFPNIEMTHSHTHTWRNLFRKLC